MSRPRLPTFIIGGMPRSGTTYLCQVLDRHPDVYMAKPYVPEPKVFIGPEKDAAEYRAHYAALFAEARGRSALGEKTSTYLESDTAPERIRRVVPDVRFIFLVREPAERAYSNYLWSTKNGLETLSFEEALRLEGSRPSPLPPEKSHARPFDYVWRGNYDRFAQRYYDVFGRDAVAFFVYEELTASPQRVLEQIQRYIGVDPLPLHEEQVEPITAARDVGPPLDRKTASALKRRLKPAVLRFEALTGLDLGAWGYDHLLD